MLVFVFLLLKAVVAFASSSQQANFFNSPKIFLSYVTDRSRPSDKPDKIMMMNTVDEFYPFIIKPVDAEEMLKQSGYGFKEFHKYDHNEKLLKDFLGRQPHQSQQLIVEMWEKIPSYFLVPGVSNEVGCLEKETCQTNALSQVGGQYGGIFNDLSQKNVFLENEINRVKQQLHQAFPQLFVEGSISSNKKETEAETETTTTTNYDVLFQELRTKSDNLEKELLAIRQQLKKVFPHFFN